MGKFARKSLLEDWSGPCEEWRYSAYESWPKVSTVPVSPAFYMRGQGWGKLYVRPILLALPRHVSIPVGFFFKSKQGREEQSSM